MSARRDKQAPQGEAPKTTRTDQSFIAGIGLAGTAVATVVLGLVIGLGAASFQIWPDSPGVPSGPAVELEVPVEVSDELPSDVLLASTLSLDFPGGATTGAPVSGGGGNGPNGPSVGADGDLVPGQGPGATPDAPAPAQVGGGDESGAAGGDAPPGNDNGSGGNPNPGVTPPRPDPPGLTGGKGHGRGNGSGKGRGGGNVTKDPAAGSSDSESATGKGKGKKAG